MRGVAMCCGFNHYGDKSLDHAVNDAALLYTRLVESGGFHGAPGLVGLGEVFTQQTSAYTILTALTRAAMSPADLVWFSFSGHAIVSGRGELRLLLPNWRHDASASEQQMYSIGASEIEAVLHSRLHSKQFVVLLDTCYSGAYGDVTVTRDVGPTIEKQLASAGAVVIAACGRHQLASDGTPGSQELNGAFTAAVIAVLDDHRRSHTALTVLELFREVKAKLGNGQHPTLYANGLTDDFAILEAPASSCANDGIVSITAEVPAALQRDLAAFLDNTVQIRRQQRVGLVQAQRQLEEMAAEFYRYGDEVFIVPVHSANVVEAFDNARRCIVGCTTPASLAEWRRSGLNLLRSNRGFVAGRGGRVVRFFFVHDGFEDQDPSMLDIVREHVAAGVFAVVVHVDSFPPVVLQEVFKDPRPDDLSVLECAFVDGQIFLRMHFAATGDLKIELDQRPTRCHHEYRTQLRPFLSGEGILFGAYPQDGGDGIVLRQLESNDINELRDQLDVDLAGAATGAGPPITPGAISTLAGGWHAAANPRRSRPAHR